MNEKPKQYLESGPEGADAGSKGESSQNDELTIIAGGADMEVTLEDGSKETVKVGHVQATKLQQFALAVSWGNMAEAAALYCRKDAQWIEKLSPSSFLAVVKKGRDLNIPFFEAWSQDQAKWKEVVAKDKLEEQRVEIARLKTDLETANRMLRSLSSAGSSPSDTASPLNK
jgi:hypothetical protein